MAQILIVEDDKAVNELIKRSLHLIGHQCDTVFNGLEAIRCIQKKNYDLQILDIMLPGYDGFDVYQACIGLPTIFLSARSSLSDRLNGLTIGADDYLTKPFEMLELLARVDAVLRRTQKPTTENTSFRIDETHIDFSQRQVFYHGQPIDLTPREFELLAVLVRNRNIALSREKLLELAWGYDYEGDTRTVDVHIVKLRKKCGLEERIKTVYKLGYRLEALAPCR